MPQLDEWLIALEDHRRRGERCVLVTLADVKGSAPRDGGTKMLVTAAGQAGSIGGGHLEHVVSEHARKMLSEGTTEARLETFSLGAHLGQCCGGKVTVLLEPFGPPDFTLALFGAGHVGKALVSVLSNVPGRILWIDARAEQFPAAIPANVEKILTPVPEDEVPDLPPGCFALVMTHSHDLDQTICERLLKRGDCRYIGLIGSDTKWRRFEARMINKGLAPELVRSIRCPIGIAGITGKHPHEIAIAVAAELLLKKYAAASAPASLDSAAQ
jgi:xanthine dehydrogenase accessory factor